MFVSKKKYQNVLNELNRIKESLKEQESRLAECDALLERATKCETEYSQLKEDHEKLTESMAMDKECSVTIKISDDFMTGIPVVRWKNETSDKLAEQGTLSFDDVGKPYPTQIALMTIAHEMLTQMIEYFNEPMAEVE